jgi:hypothetical protein
MHIRKINCGKELLDEVQTVVLPDGHETINLMKLKNFHLMGIVLGEKGDIEVPLLHNRPLESAVYLAMNVLIHLTEELLRRLDMLVWIIVNTSTIIGFEVNKPPISARRLSRRSRLSE